MAFESNHKSFYRESVVK